MGLKKEQKKEAEKMEENREKNNKKIEDEKRLEQDLFGDLQIGCLYGCDVIASPGGLAIGGYGEFHRFIMIYYIMQIGKRLYVIMFNIKICDN